MRDVLWAIWQCVLDLKCWLGLHSWFDANGWLSPFDQYCVDCLRDRRDVEAWRFREPE